MLVAFIAPAKFTEQDHETWSKLFNRQIHLLEDRACSFFQQGLKKLDFSDKEIPDFLENSEKLKQLIDWTLVNAENKYLNDEEWFDHLLEKEFPTTDFIRKPNELEFTPLPDLFHEVFGHLPIFANKEIAELADLFAEAFAIAPKNKKHWIARLWWHTLEFGLLKENGEIKIFGAGLISSNQELKHCLDSSRHKPFNFKEITQTPKAVANIHPHFFVMESLDQVRKVLHEFIRHSKQKLRLNMNKPNGLKTWRQTQWQA